MAAGAAGRNAGGLRKRCRNAFRQIHRTRAPLMSGKYDWKPGQGVRSVGDVFKPDRYGETACLAGVLSGTPNTGARPAPSPIRRNCRKALKASYVNLQKRLRDFSTTPAGAGETVGKDDDESRARWMPSSKIKTRASGQSIAYARSNGLVPPLVPK